jgi:predicted nucleic acid-binding protein
MTIFVDTSAFLALLSANDQAHDKAEAAWSRWLLSGTTFITTNYIVVETVDRHFADQGFTCLPEITA